MTPVKISIKRLAKKKVSHSRAPVNGEEADDDGDHLGRVHEEEVGVDVARVLPHGAPDEAEVHHEGGEPGEPDHDHVLPDDAVPKELDAAPRSPPLLLPGVPLPVSVQPNCIEDVQLYIWPQ